MTKLREREGEGEGVREGGWAIEGKEGYMNEK